MKKIKIHTFSLKRVKKNIFPILFCLFTLCLILFSNTNIQAAKTGLSLWANSVIPALFPFFIATGLLKQTNIISKIGRVMQKVIRPLFNIPGEGAYAFVMGIISGYPVGAKVVSELYENGTCTKQEAERMLSYTNNSGPLFILGTVGITLLGSTKTGILLLLTHIFASITVGIILGIKSKYGKKANNKTIEHIREKTKTNTNKEVTFENLGEVIGSSIMDASKTIIMIGGFIVLFCVINSMLVNSNTFDIIGSALAPLLKIFGISKDAIIGFLSGILEITNGISLISKVPVKLLSTHMVLIAFLLGFGGISVMLQVFSIIAKHKLSIKSYIQGKLLQGMFAGIYTYILLTTTSFFNLDITPTFAPYLCAPIAVSPFSVFGIIMVLIIIGSFFCFGSCYEPKCYNKGCYNKRSYRK